MHRKSAPKVKNGRVQKKNRHELTPNYWNTRQHTVQIDVEKPGKGCKHFLKKRDIVKFLGLLPNWEEVSVGLDAVVLATVEAGCDGWYSNGVIGICAWDQNKTIETSASYFEDHQAIFDRLNVEYANTKNGIICHFTDHQIIAYQLLHIFLHELGHHHDRISTKHPTSNIPHGEDYAENYAFKCEKIIWNRFFECFEMV